MTKYSITNAKGKEINKEFNNNTEAIYWVLDHLDLSEDWAVEYKTEC